MHCPKAKPVLDRRPYDKPLIMDNDTPTLKRSRDDRREEELVAATKAFNLSAPTPAASPEEGFTLPTDNSQDITMGNSAVGPSESSGPTDENQDPREDIPAPSPGNPFDDKAKPRAKSLPAKPLASQNPVSQSGLVPGGVFHVPPGSLHLSRDHRQSNDSSIVTNPWDENPTTDTYGQAMLKKNVPVFDDSSEPRSSSDSRRSDDSEKDHKRKVTRREGVADIGDTAPTSTRSSRSSFPEAHFNIYELMLGMGWTYPSGIVEWQAAKRGEYNLSHRCNARRRSFAAVCFPVF